eukprot:773162-Lingulodinium_polyedra.AAC.1
MFDFVSVRFEPGNVRGITLDTVIVELIKRIGVGVAELHTGSNGSRNTSQTSRQRSANMVWCVWSHCCLRKQAGTPSRYAAHAQTWE